MLSVLLSHVSVQIGMSNTDLVYFSSPVPTFVSKRHTGPACLGWASRFLKVGVLVGMQSPMWEAFGAETGADVVYDDGERSFSCSPFSSDCDAIVVDDCYPRPALRSLLLGDKPSCLGVQHVLSIRLIFGNQCVDSEGL